MNTPLKTTDQIRSLCIGWITTIKECSELFSDWIDFELVNAFKKIRILLDFNNYIDEINKSNSNRG